MATSLSKKLFSLFLISGLLFSAVLGRTWIETDDCVSTCGLNHKTVSIPSDPFLDRRFMRRLCSPECYLNCPNTVDLYFSAVAGEGFFLPNFCQINGFRREMTEKLGFASTPETPMGSNPDDHVIYPSPVPGKNI